MYVVLIYLKFLCTLPMQQVKATALKLVGELAKWIDNHHDVLGMYMYICMCTLAVGTEGGCFRSQNTIWCGVCPYINKYSYQ